MLRSRDRYLVHRPCREHLVSPNIFPELHCQSHCEVIEEAAKFVHALQCNQDLQKEFISLLRKPARDLLKFLHKLRSLGEKLDTESVREGSYPELLAHLPTSSSHTMDQVTALIIATEAFRELDSVSVDCILSLTSEERNNIFILFKTIPLGTSAHGLCKPAMSESDPVYHQLLNRIGFSNWRGKLIYERELGYSGLDKITLTIIAIHSVSSITLNH